VLDVPAEIFLITTAGSLIGGDPLRISGAIPSEKPLLLAPPGCPWPHPGEARRR
jgi:hypothetical protein